MTPDQALQQYLSSKVEGSSRHSLSAFIGKKIADVIGHLSREYDDAVFAISAIVLDDGTFLNVEGEHDFSYIGSKLPGISRDLLNQITEPLDEE